MARLRFLYSGLSCWSVHAGRVLRREPGEWDYTSTIDNEGHLQLLATVAAYPAPDTKEETVSKDDKKDDKTKDGDHKDSDSTSILETKSKVTEVSKSSKGDKSDAKDTDKSKVEKDSDATSKDNKNVDGFQDASKKDSKTSGANDSSSVGSSANDSSIGGSIKSISEESSSSQKESGSKMASNSQRASKDAEPDSKLEKTKDFPDAMQGYTSDNLMGHEYYGSVPDDFHQDVIPSYRDTEELRKEYRLDPDGFYHKYGIPHPREKGCAKSKVHEEGTGDLHGRDVNNNRGVRPIWDGRGVGVGTWKDGKWHLDDGSGYYDEYGKWWPRRANNGYGANSDYWYGNSEDSHQDRRYGGTQQGGSDDAIYADTPGVFVQRSDYYPPRSCAMWDEWSSCSKQCGPGTRSRICIVEQQREEQNVATSFLEIGRNNDKDSLGDTSDSTSTSDDPARHVVESVGAAFVEIMKKRQNNDVLGQRQAEMDRALERASQKQQHQQIIEEIERNKWHQQRGPPMLAKNEDNAFFGNPAQYPKSEFMSNNWEQNVAGAIGQDVRSQDVMYTDLNSADELYAKYGPNYNVAVNAGVPPYYIPRVMQMYYNSDYNTKGDFGDYLRELLKTGDVLDNEFDPKIYGKVNYSYEKSNYNLDPSRDFTSHVLNSIDEKNVLRDGRKALLDEKLKTQDEDELLKLNREKEMGLAYRDQGRPHFGESTSVAKLKEIGANAGEILTVAQPLMTSDPLDEYHLDHNPFHSDLNRPHLLPGTSYDAMQWQMNHFGEMFSDADLARATNEVMADWENERSKEREKHHVNPYIAAKNQSIALLKNFHDNNPPMSVLKMPAKDLGKTNAKLGEWRASDLFPDSFSNYKTMAEEERAAQHAERKKAANMREKEGLVFGTKAAAATNSQAVAPTSLAEQALEAGIEGKVSVPATGSSTSEWIAKDRFSNGEREEESGFWDSDRGYQSDIDPDLEVKLHKDMQLPVKGQIQMKKGPTSMLDRVGTNHGSGKKTLNANNMFADGRKSDEDLGLGEMTTDELDLIKTAERERKGMRSDGGYPGDESFLKKEGQATPDSNHHLGRMKNEVGEMVVESGIGNILRDLLAKRGVHVTKAAHDSNTEYAPLGRAQPSQMEKNYKKDLDFLEREAKDPTQRNADSNEAEKLPSNYSMEPEKKETPAASLVQHQETAPAVQDWDHDDDHSYHGITPDELKMLVSQAAQQYAQIQNGIPEAKPVEGSSVEESIKKIVNSAPGNSTYSEKVIPMSTIEKKATEDPKASNDSNGRADSTGAEGSKVANGAPHKKEFGTFMPSGDEEVTPGIEEAAQGVTQNLVQIDSTRVKLPTVAVKNEASTEVHGSISVKSKKARDLLAGIRVDKDVHDLQTEDLDFLRSPMDKEGKKVTGNDGKHFQMDIKENSLTERMANQDEEELAEKHKLGLDKFRTSMSIAADNANLPGAHPKRLKAYSSEDHEFELASEIQDILGKSGKKHIREQDIERLIRKAAREYTEMRKTHSTFGPSSMMQMGSNTDMVSHTDEKTDNDRNEAHQNAQEDTVLDLHLSKNSEPVEALRNSVGKLGPNDFYGDGQKESVPGFDLDGADYSIDKAPEELVKRHQQTRKTINSIPVRQDVQIDNSDGSIPIHPDHGISGSVRKGHSINQGDLLLSGHSEFDEDTMKNLSDEDLDMYSSHIGTDGSQKVLPFRHAAKQRIHSGNEFDDMTLSSVTSLTDGSKKKYGGSKPAPQWNSDMPLEKLQNELGDFVGSGAIGNILHDVWRTTAPVIKNTKAAIGRDPSSFLTKLQAEAETQYATLKAKEKLAGMKVTDEEIGDIMAKVLGHPHGESAINSGNAKAVHNGEADSKSNVAAPSASLAETTDPKEKAKREAFAAFEDSLLKIKKSVAPMDNAEIEAAEAMGRGGSEALSKDWLYGHEIMRALNPKDVMSTAELGSKTHHLNKFFKNKHHHHKYAHRERLGIHMNRERNLEENSFCQSRLHCGYGKSKGEDDSSLGEKEPHSKFAKNIGKGNVLGTSYYKDAGKRVYTYRAYLRPNSISPNDIRRSYFGVRHQGSLPSARGFAALEKKAEENTLDTARFLTIVGHTLMRTVVLLDHLTVASNRVAPDPGAIRKWNWHMTPPTDVDPDKPGIQVLDPNVPGGTIDWDGKTGSRFGFGNLEDIYGPIDTSGKTYNRSPAGSDVHEYDFYNHDAKIIMNHRGANWVVSGVDAHGQGVLSGKDHDGGILGNLGNSDSDSMDNSDSMDASGNASSMDNSDSNDGKPNSNSNSMDTSSGTRDASSGTGKGPPSDGSSGKGASEGFSEKTASDAGSGEGAESTLSSGAEAGGRGDLDHLLGHGWERNSYDLGGQYGRLWHAWHKQGSDHPNLTHTSRDPGMVPRRPAPLGYEWTEERKPPDNENPSLGDGRHCSNKNGVHGGLTPAEKIHKVPRLKGLFGYPSQLGPTCYHKNPRKRTGFRRVDDFTTLYHCRDDARGLHGIDISDPAIAATAGDWADRGLLDKNGELRHNLSPAALTSFINGDFYRNTDDAWVDHNGIEDPLDWVSGYKEAKENLNDEHYIKSATLPVRSVPLPTPDDIKNANIEPLVNAAGVGSSGAASFGSEMDVATESVDTGGSSFLDKATINALSQEATRKHLNTQAAALDPTKKGFFIDSHGLAVSTAQSDAQEARLAGSVYAKKALASGGSLDQTNATRVVVDAEGKVMGDTLPIAGTNEKLGDINKGGYQSSNPYTYYDSSIVDLNTYTGENTPLNDVNLIAKHILVGPEEDDSISEKEMNEFIKPLDMRKTTSPAHTEVLDIAKLPVESLTDAALVKGIDDPFAYNVVKKKFGKQMTEPGLYNIAGKRNPPSTEEIQTTARRIFSTADPGSKGAAYTTFGASDLEQIFERRNKYLSGADYEMKDFIGDPRVQKMVHPDTHPDSDKMLVKHPNTFPSWNPNALKPWGTGVMKEIDAIPINATNMNGILHPNGSSPAAPAVKGGRGAPTAGPKPAAVKPVTTDAPSGLSIKGVSQAIDATSKGLGSPDGKPPAEQHVQQQQSSVHEQQQSAHSAAQQNVQPAPKQIPQPADAVLQQKQNAQPAPQQHVQPAPWQHVHPAPGQAAQVAPKPNVQPPAAVVQQKQSVQPPAQQSHQPTAKPNAQPAARKHVQTAPKQNAQPPVSVVQQTQIVQQVAKSQQQQKHVVQPAQHPPQPAPVVPASHVQVNQSPAQHAQIPAQHAAAQNEIPPQQYLERQQAPPQKHQASYMQQYQQYQQARAEYGAPAEKYGAPADYYGRPEREHYYNQRGQYYGQSEGEFEQYSNPRTEYYHPYGNSYAQPQHRHGYAQYHRGRRSFYGSSFIQTGQNTEEEESFANANEETALRGKKPGTNTKSGKGAETPADNAKGVDEKDGTAEKDGSAENSTENSGEGKAGETKIVELEVPDMIEEVTFSVTMEGQKLDDHHLQTLTRALRLAFRDPRVVIEPVPETAEKLAGMIETTLPNHVEFDLGLASRGTYNIKDGEYFVRWRIRDLTAAGGAALISPINGDHAPDGDDMESDSNTSEDVTHQGGEFGGNNAPRSDEADQKADEDDNQVKKNAHGDEHIARTSGWHALRKWRRSTIQDFLLMSQNITEFFEYERHGTFFVTKELARMPSNERKLLYRHLLLDDSYDHLENLPFRIEAQLWFQQKCESIGECMSTVAGRCGWKPPVKGVLKASQSDVFFTQKNVNLVQCKKTCEARGHCSGLGFEPDKDGGMHAWHPAETAFIEDGSKPDPLAADPFTTSSFFERITAPENIPQSTNDDDEQDEVNERESSSGLTESPDDLWSGKTNGKTHLEKKKTTTKHFDNEGEAYLHAAIISYLEQHREKIALLENRSPVAAQATSFLQVTNMTPTKIAAANIEKRAAQFDKKNAGVKGEKKRANMKGVKHPKLSAEEVMLAKNLREQQKHFVRSNQYSSGGRRDEDEDSDKHLGAGGIIHATNSSNPDGETDDHVRSGAQLKRNEGDPADGTGNETGNEDEDAIASRASRFALNGAMEDLTYQQYERILQDENEHESELGDKDNQWWLNLYQQNLARQDQQVYLDQLKRAQRSIMNMRINQEKEYIKDRREEAREERLANREAAAEERMQRRQDAEMERQLHLKSEQNAIDYAGGISSVLRSASDPVNRIVDAIDREHQNLLLTQEDLSTGLDGLARVGENDNDDAAVLDNDSAIVESDSAEDSTDVGALSVNQAGPEARLAAQYGELINDEAALRQHAPDSESAQQAAAYSDHDEAHSDYDETPSTEDMEESSLAENDLVTSLVQVAVNKHIDRLEKYKRLGSTGEDVLFDHPGNAESSLFQNAGTVSIVQDSESESAKLQTLVESIFDICARELTRQEWLDRRADREEWERYKKKWGIRGNVLAQIKSKLKQIVAKTEASERSAANSTAKSVANSTSTKELGKVQEATGTNSTANRVQETAGTYNSSGTTSTAQTTDSKANDILPKDEVSVSLPGDYPMMEYRDPTTQVPLTCKAVFPKGFDTVAEWGNPDPDRTLDKIFGDLAAHEEVGITAENLIKFFIYFNKKYWKKRKEEKKAMERAEQLRIARADREAKNLKGLHVGASIGQKNGLRKQSERPAGRALDRILGKMAESAGIAPRGGDPKGWGPLADAVLAARGTSGQSAQLVHSLQEHQGHEPEDTDAALTEGAEKDGERSTLKRGTLVKMFANNIYDLCASELTNREYKRQQKAKGEPAVAGAGAAGAATTAAVSHTEKKNKDILALITQAVSETIPDDILRRNYSGGALYGTIRCKDLFPKGFKSMKEIGKGSPYRNLRKKFAEMFPRNRKGMRPQQEASTYEDFKERHKDDFGTKYGHRDSKHHMVGSKNDSDPIYSDPAPKAVHFDHGDGFQDGFASSQDSSNSDAENSAGETKNSSTSPCGSTDAADNNADSLSSVLNEKPVGDVAILNEDGAEQSNASIAKLAMTGVEKGRATSVIQTNPADSSETSLSQSQKVSTQQKAMSMAKGIYDLCAAEMNEYEFEQGGWPPKEKREPSMLQVITKAAAENIPDVILDREYAAPHSITRRLSCRQLFPKGWGTYVDWGRGDVYKNLSKVLSEMRPREGNGIQSGWEADTVNEFDDKVYGEDRRHKLKTGIDSSLAEMTEGATTSADASAQTEENLVSKQTTEAEAESEAESQAEAESRLELVTASIWELCASELAAAHDKAQAEHGDKMNSMHKGYMVENFGGQSKGASSLITQTGIPTRIDSSGQNFDDETPLTDAAEASFNQAFVQVKEKLRNPTSAILTERFQSSGRYGKVSCGQLFPDGAMKLGTGNWHHYLSNRRVKGLQTTSADHKEKAAFGLPPDGMGRHGERRGRDFASTVDVRKEGWDRIQSAQPWNQSIARPLRSPDYPNVGSFDYHPPRSELTEKEELGEEAAQTSAQTQSAAVQSHDAAKSSKLAHTSALARPWTHPSKSGFSPEKIARSLLGVHALEVEKSPKDRALREEKYYPDRLKKFYPPGGLDHLVTPNSYVEVKSKKANGGLRRDATSSAKKSTSSVNDADVSAKSIVSAHERGSAMTGNSVTGNNIPLSSFIELKHKKYHSKHHHRHKRHRRHLSRLQKLRKLIGDDDKFESFIHTLYAAARKKVKAKLAALGIYEYCRTALAKEHFNDPKQTSKNQGMSLLEKNHGMSLLEVGIQQIIQPTLGHGHMLAAGLGAGSLDAKVSLSDLSVLNDPENAKILSELTQKIKSRMRKLANDDDILKEDFQSKGLYGKLSCQDLFPGGYESMKEMGGSDAQAYLKDKLAKMVPAAFEGDGTTKEKIVKAFRDLLESEKKRKTKATGDGQSAGTGMSVLELGDGDAPEANAEESLTSELGKLLNKSKSEVAKWTDKSHVEMIKKGVSSLLSKHTGNSAEKEKHAKDLAKGLAKVLTDLGLPESEVPKLTADGLYPLLQPNGTFSSLASTSHGDSHDSNLREFFSNMYSALTNTDSKPRIDGTYSERDKAAFLGDSAKYDLLRSIFPQDANDQKKLESMAKSSDLEKTLNEAIVKAKLMELKNEPKEEIKEEAAGSEEQSLGPLDQLFKHWNSHNPIAAVKGDKGSDHYMRRSDSLGNTMFNSWGPIARNTMDYVANPGGPHESWYTTSDGHKIHVSPLTHTGTCKLFGGSKVFASRAGQEHLAPFITTKEEKACVSKYLNTRELGNVKSVMFGGKKIKWSKAMLRAPLLRVLPFYTNIINEKNPGYVSQLDRSAFCTSFWDCHQLLQSAGLNLDYSVGTNIQVTSEMESTQKKLSEKESTTGSSFGLAETDASSEDIDEAFPGKTDQKTGDSKAISIIDEEPANASGDDTHDSSIPMIRADVKGTSFLEMGKTPTDPAARAAQLGNDPADLDYGKEYENEDGVRQSASPKITGYSVNVSGTNDTFLSPWYSDPTAPNVDKMDLYFHKRRPDPNFVVVSGRKINRREWLLNQMYGPLDTPEERERSSKVERSSQSPGSYTLGNILDRKSYDPDLVNAVVKFNKKPRRRSEYSTTNGVNEEFVTRSDGNSDSDDASSIVAASTAADSDGQDLTALFGDSDSDSPGSKSQRHINPLDLKASTLLVTTTNPGEFLNQLFDVYMKKTNIQGEDVLAALKKYGRNGIDSLPMQSFVSAAEESEEPVTVDNGEGGAVPRTGNAKPADRNAGNSHETSSAASSPSSGSSIGKSSSSAGSNQNWRDDTFRNIELANESAKSPGSLGSRSGSSSENGESGKSGPHGSRNGHSRSGSHGSGTSDRIDRRGSDGGLIAPKSGLESGWKKVGDPNEGNGGFAGYSIEGLGLQTNYIDNKWRNPDTEALNSPMRQTQDYKWKLRQDFRNDKAVISRVIGPWLGFHKVDRRRFVDALRDSGMHMKDLAVPELVKIVAEFSKEEKIKEEADKIKQGTKKLEQTKKKQEENAKAMSDRAKGGDEDDQVLNVNALTNEDLDAKLG